MRNIKVKVIKKYAVLSLALFMLSAGVSFAAATWDEVKTEAAAGTVNLTSDVTTDGAPLRLGTPPVPGSAVNVINGNGNTITAGGAGSTSTNFIINNEPNAVTQINNTNFKGGNITGNGGAIQNTATMVVQGTNGNKATFDGNKANGVGVSQGWGGAIYNSSTVGGTSLDVKNAVFTNNSARNAGGAIANLGGEITIDSAVFDGNSVGFVPGESDVSNSQGGAIVNAATMTITNSTFQNNTSAGLGGALSNALNQSGAITTTIVNSSFINNSASTGGAGAILNTGSSSSAVHTLHIKEGTSFVGNYVVNNDNRPDYAGGAIINESKTGNDGSDAVLIIEGSANNKILFKNNIAGNGGAIKNSGTATIDNAIFDSNGINNDVAGNVRTSNGGAIYNITDAIGDAKLTVSNTEFKDNTASGYGGAIYNRNGDVTIIDSNFTNNSAGATAALSNGGAIYGGSGSKTAIRATGGRTVNIGNENSIANRTDSIVFAGSYDQTTKVKTVATGNFESNGNLNIYSNVSGNTVTDNTSGETVYLTDVNFNKTDAEGNAYNGNVNFKGDAALSNANVNIHNGMVSFEHDKSFGSSNILNLYGGTLNLLNGEYGAYQLQAKELNMQGDAGIMLDVDLAGTYSPDGKPGMDGIYKDNFGKITNDGGHTLTVQGMKSLTEAISDNVKIQFTDADPLIGHVALGNGANIVEAPINKYSVTQITQPSDGSMGDPGEYFEFSKIGNSDSIIAGPVAAQAAFLMMDNLYRQSFANMDMVTLMTPEQRMAWKMRNKYANAGYHTGVYAPNVIPEERDGWYFRPFSNFENVPLKNGPKVSNVSYGTLIGGESDLIDLGHGWDGNFSLFGAYHGSHQAYNGVGIYQNGGTLGGVATAYKGNFWTGVTANVGASAARASHAFGSDDFPIIMTGAAWKSGYNWGLFSNKVVIQPSYMMSYTFVNVFDYNNAAGVKVSQDPLNAIEIIPGLRIIGNLKNGWQPYLGVNMTWNIMDRTKFYANEVPLTQLSVKPYIEYGVGLQKRTGDRFTGFGQAMIRNGGRNGIALTMGFRWALGN